MDYPQYLMDFELIIMLKVHFLYRSPPQESLYYMQKKKTPVLVESYQSQKITQDSEGVPEVIAISAVRVILVKRCPNSIVRIF